MTKAVILAEGTESGSVADRTTPRCLIEIGGQTILQRQIEILKSCGFQEEDIIVVIGERGKAWSEENKEKVKKLHNHVIVNPHNLETRNSYSFWLAVKDIKDDLLYIDGDVLFSKEVLENLIKSNYPSAILTKKMRHLLGGNKVSVKNDRVVNVKAYSEPDVIYVGVAKFSKDLLEELKKELNAIEHFNSTLAIPLDNLCASHYIHNLDIESIVDVREGLAK